MTSVWVVLPTYDERENLPAVVALARAALANCDPPVDGTVLVVDDASPDGTGELADQLAREHADVRVHHRPGKGGLGGAYLAGFELAGAVRRRVVDDEHGALDGRVAARERGPGERDDGREVLSFVVGGEDDPDAGHWWLLGEDVR